MALGLAGTQLHAAPPGPGTTPGRELLPNPTSPTDGTATIAVGGDLILADAVNALAAEQGPGTLLGDLTILREADLAIANLESVATAAGERVPKDELAPYYFRSRPETLAVLSATGIDAVATANNHVGDFGSAALVEQGLLLDSMGIGHAGSGASLGDACRPIFLDAGDDLVVALFSADTTQPEFAADERAAGTCHLDIADLSAWEDTFSEALAASERQAHAVLFAVHWGDDWVAEPSDEKRALGRLLIDMGVDAVLGSNAHVLQGIERHEGGVIIHDGGNLLAPFAQPSESAIMALTLGRNGIESLEVLPILVGSNGSGTRMAADAEADRVLQRIAELSAALGTDVSSGSLTFDPVGRPSERPATDMLISPRDASEAPAPAAAPPPGCLVSDVPQDARIDPVEIGPLSLLGVRVTRDQYLLPELIEVDLYWTLSEPVAESHTIIPHGVRDGTELDLWLSQHEPCDWGWPVGRWAPGEIYRDQAALRPPPQALSVVGAASVLSGAGGPLEISVGVGLRGEEIARSKTLAVVEVGVPQAALGLIAALIPLALVGLVLVVRRRWPGRRPSAGDDGPVG